MSEAILRLSADDVWIVLEDIDAVVVVAEELIGRTVGTTIEHDCRITRWNGGPAHDDADLVALECTGMSALCVLAAASLRMARSAALTALAARELLMPGGVTVAVLGATPATQLQLSLIARYLPDISHVATCVPAGRSSNLPYRLVEQLEQGGIAVSVANSLSDTVFGANLVVAGEETVLADLSGLRLADLTRGAVFVNATGHDLPADLVDQVGELYVDDLALLADNKGRHFVAAHLAAAHNRYGSTLRIAADLGQLLVNEHLNREQHDRPVLVELLSTDQLSVPLAHHILEAALRERRGTWL